MSFLRVLWHWRKKGKEEAKIKQGNVGSSSYNKIHCRYQRECVFSLLDVACMVLHVALFYHGMGFSRCKNIFSLDLPFQDRHGVKGFSCFVELGC